MKKNKFLFLLLLALFGVFWCINVDNATVFADGVPDYRLAISPTQRGFGDLKPGETYSDKFKVKNTGVKDFTFSVSFSPYSVESETYSPDYISETKFTNLSKWLSVDVDSGIVKAGDEEEITYSFTVPEDAAGGAQMATIMVSMGLVESEADDSVQSVRRLGYLIYGNVDGDVIRTGKVIENKIPSFLFNPPITATSVVENTGNVYTVAQYSLQVFPLFSDEEIYTNEETPEGNVVFPETKKLNTISWEGAPQLGIFKVRQTVKIFDEESVTEKIVFLCPLWFLFIVILLIFCIIFWIVSRIIKRKKENY